MKATLYHGTTKEGYEGIIESGFICGKAYFTPDYTMAEAYAFDNDGENGVVIEVEIDTNELQIDMESYDGDNLEKALAENVSVYTNNDVQVALADYYFLND